MSVFLPEMDKKFKIHVVEVKDKKVDEARNIISDFFIAKNYDYLLFLDDDHSGHTVEMVEALIKPDEYICAIKCYSKTLPHLCTLMDYSGHDHPLVKYKPKDNKNGYDYCDLVGFGMTIIKRELFDKISVPYFVAEDNRREDNYFCDKMQSVGIKPIGCFDYVLTHNGINQENAEIFNNELLKDLAEDLKNKIPNFDEEKIIIVA